ncbi:tetratricopeptide repeat protein [Candidatus Babeliales bacterium]|nr:tetratricopeptide repeat protein [Candidatus Babeliales bacterium]
MVNAERKRVLKEELKQDPNNTKTLIEIGFLNILEDGDWEESLKILNHVLKIDPENVEAMFWLAKSYVHCFFDEQKAKEILGKALRIKPNDAACNQLLADVLDSLGYKFEISISHLKKAIKSEPTWITPRIRMGLYLMENHKFDEAEKEAKEALKVFKKLNFTTTNTRMEEYYEESVRGRIPRKKKYIEQMLQDIKKAKLQSDKSKK